MNTLSRELVIRAKSHETGYDTVLLENGVTVEYYKATINDNLVNAIFAVRITEKLPGKEAYFADMGKKMKAFINDANLGDVKGYKLVQVENEAYDKKGYRITSEIKLTGEYVVLLPNHDTCNVSKKILDNNKISELREFGKKIISENDNIGVIFRTECENSCFDDIRKDYVRMVSLWEEILQKFKEASSPGLLYKEGDTVSKIFIKYPKSKFDKIYCDSAEFSADFCSRYPEMSDKVVCLDKNTFDILTVKNIEPTLSSLFGKKIWLKSGAYITIDYTEAMTVIDVNSGKAGKKANFTNINTEAATEIMRQLRLRDIGGIIICDFIDNKEKEAGNQLLSYMRSIAVRDSVKTYVVDYTALGLVEITRKRGRKHY